MYDSKHIFVCEIQMFAVVNHYLHATGHATARLSRMFSHIRLVLYMRQTKHVVYNAHMTIDIYKNH